MSRFVEAKAWKVFCFVFVIPLILEFSSIFYMPKVIGHESVALYVQLLPILTLSSITFFYMWLYLSSTVLNKVISQETRPKLITFRISFLYSLLSIYVAKIIEYHFVLSGKNAQYLGEYLLPVKLVALVCFLYCILFVAKSLVTIEKNRAINLTKYLSTASLIAIFPIGVWKIQPRIRNVLAVA